MTRPDITPETSFDIVTAPKRDSLHWQPDEVTWGELIAWMARPAARKDCGNYMGGTLQQTHAQHKRGKTTVDCTDFHRTKLAVVRRGLLTLDVDYPAADFLLNVEMQLDHAALVHTTYSSTPLKPRYRLIIPLDRTVAPDEYYTAAAAVMQQLGEEQFDAGSVQPERYMFRPSEQEPGYFSHHVQPGPPASADALLLDFNPDLSATPLPKPGKNKRDPFAIEGTIGAFNRAYEDFQHLIDEYDLPYTPAGADRWQLTGASAAAGMGVVDAGLVYSHHANDPAYGETCNAFDLARLHLYGDLDADAKPKTPITKLPSHAAMAERATTDLRVVRELVGADFDDDMDATEDGIALDNWRLGLRLSSTTGTPTDTIGNWDLIAENDAAFRVLYFNELSMAIEINGPLPWRKLGDRPTFDSGDRSALALHIEREYHIRPARGYLDDLIADQAMPRRVNPVRDYLDGLKWDGKARVEECLPGVRPTPFTRLAARKSLTAAVARMYEPGIKWDHMLVLFGPEGLGKSWWVDRMARGYSSSLGPISNKDTLITMQRSWIMMADEGHSLRKADFDAQKEFLTRTADVFRMPYDRESQVHKRHNVIWGSTNDDVFLRRQEGNRRFLIVRCEAKVDFDRMTDEYVDQVWAEAVHLYRAGERLFLGDEGDSLARDAREDFTEEDAYTGIIQEYMDTLVPEDWPEMELDARQQWLADRAAGFAPAGTARIDRVCSVQIWVEALGKRIGDHRRVDLLEINKALKNIPGWTAMPGNKRVPGYGPQKVFERLEDASDLI